LDKPLYEVDHILPKINIQKSTKRFFLIHLSSTIK
jgi:hypothetical protein